MVLDVLSDHSVFWLSGFSPPVLPWYCHQYCAGVLVTALLSVLLRAFQLVTASCYRQVVRSTGPGATKINIIMMMINLVSILIS